MSSPKEQQKFARWYALDVLVQGEAREAVEYALMEAGALGTETNDAHNEVLRVTAYFDRLPELEGVRAELAEALRIYELPSSAITEMNAHAVEDQDWLGEWKKSWQPVETGRFIIAPPWSEALPGDRIVIRIEPGMAFGTGTHETTRLCLAAIEKYYEGGSFLDVGTGTGILAIAAAKLFPAAVVVAHDTDIEALAIAKQNASLNEIATQIDFRAGAVDNSTASADFVCANLTADVIVELTPSLLEVTCGRLVLSGILESQVKSIIDRVKACGGPDPIEIMNAGEWVAVVL